MVGTEIKTLAKKIFPAKSVVQDREIQWSKQGGQSGAKSLDLIAAKAKAEGFVQQSHTNTAGQSGNVRDHVVLVHANGSTLQLAYCYGLMAHQNLFSATLTV